MLKGLYIAGTNDYTIPADVMNILNSKMLDVCEIDGLGRPSADLYTTELVGTDASVYSGQTVKSRQITLSVKPRNDLERMKLYRLLGYGQKKRLFFENDAGIYWIDGYVKSATYAAKPAQRAEIEIPIFCPYPWFRSIEARQKAFAFGGDAITLQHNGDMPAGIKIYAPAQLAGRMIGFTLESGENRIEYGSNEVYSNSGGSTAYTLICETTPGVHRFHAAKSIRDIKITGGWITVPADDSIDLSADIRYIGSGTFTVEQSPLRTVTNDGNMVIISQNIASKGETVTPEPVEISKIGYAIWHDTWSGI